MRERERGAARRGDVQRGQIDEEGSRRWRRRGHGRLWRGHAAALGEGEEDDRGGGGLGWPTGPARPHRNGLHREVSAR